MFVRANVDSHFTKQGRGKGHTQSSRYCHRETQSSPARLAGGVCLEGGRQRYIDAVTWSDTVHPQRFKALNPVSERRGWQAGREDLCHPPPVKNTRENTKKNDAVPYQGSRRCRTPPAKDNVLNTCLRMGETDVQTDLKTSENRLREVAEHLEQHRSELGAPPAELRHADGPAVQARGVRDDAERAHQVRD